MNTMPFPAAVTRVSNYETGTRRGSWALTTDPVFRPTLMIRQACDAIAVLDRLKRLRAHA